MGIAVSPGEKAVYLYRLVVAVMIWGGGVKLGKI